MRIQPVVEGHGEVAAVPVLLRRLRDASGAFELGFNPPIRRHRSELLQEAALRRTVRLALLQEGCRGVLILLDADDDCPRELAPRVQAWAIDEAGGVPCAVVMANREYEAWFLAGLESLRGRRGILEDALSPADPESARGAKEQLERSMEVGRGYAETTDQAALTALFDLASAYRRCRSFRRLVHAFELVAAGAGATLTDWPPAFARE